MIIFHRVTSIHTAKTMKLFFQFSCNILTIYKSRCSCMCAVLLLSLSSQSKSLLHLILVLLQKVLSFDISTGKGENHETCEIYL